MAVSVSSDSLDNAHVYHLSPAEQILHLENDRRCLSKKILFHHLSLRSCPLELDYLRRHHDLKWAKFEMKKTPNILESGENDSIDSYVNGDGRFRGKLFFSFGASIIFLGILC